MYSLFVYSNLKSADYLSYRTWPDIPNIQQPKNPIPDVMEYARRLPALFVSGSSLGIYEYVEFGWIDDARQVGHTVQLVPKLAGSKPIPISAFRRELDEFGLDYHHIEAQQWKIKDIDLFEALARSGLMTEASAVAAKYLFDSGRYDRSPFTGVLRTAWRPSPIERTTWNTATVADSKRRIMGSVASALWPKSEILARAQTSTTSLALPRTTLGSIARTGSLFEGDERAGLRLLPETPRFFLQPNPADSASAALKAALSPLPTRVVSKAKVAPWQSAVALPRGNRASAVIEAEDSTSAVQARTSAQMAKRPLGAAIEALLAPPSERAKVAIVRCHDQLMNMQVLLCLGKFDLDVVNGPDPTIQGRTALQIFIDEVKDAKYAVVLMAPSSDTPGGKDARSQENVSFQLGYLIRHVGIQNVCIVAHRDATLPPMLSGLGKIVLCDDGTWELSLARELRNAKLPVDLNRL